MSRRRIGLLLALLAFLAAAYRFRVLPGRADVLLDYFLYMCAATTFTPLPVIPVIVHAATLAPVLLVALVGALGTTVAYLIEYAVLGRVLAHDRLGKVRQSRAYLWLAGVFDRLPFASLTLAAFLPLPVDGVRLVAIARGYDRRRFALAAFLGRLPRYALVAGLGYSLRFALPFVSAAGPAVEPAAAAIHADSTAAADPRLRATLERLDHGTAHLRATHARFRQERWSPAFDEPERSRGELWFRRPGDLVLRYDEPDAQEVYIDSAGVWIYLKREKQAQHYPFMSRGERDAALAVLWQPSSVLAELYELARAPAPPAGETSGEWLRLVPRDPELGQVVACLYVRLAPKTGLSDCVVVEQQSGERTRLEVEKVERNPGLPDRLFRFTPPPGVEVVRF